MKEIAILITGINSKVGNAFEQHIKEIKKTKTLEYTYVIDKISLRSGKWKEVNFRKYDVILHVAGIIDSDTGTVSKEREGEYYHINRDLTCELAQKAKLEGVRQFIYLSTMMVYGIAASIGYRNIIDKETEPSPKNVYGRSKFAGEEVKKLEDNNFKVFIIREPIIYGENFEGEIMKLAKLAKRIPFFPEVTSTKSWIYQGNLCELIRLGIENRLSGIFHPQDRKIFSTSNLYKELARIQGKKCILIRHFKKPIILVAKINSHVNDILGDMSYSNELSNIEKINYQIFDFEEAIKRMLNI